MENRRLKKELFDKKISQVKLASILGVSKTTVQNWCSGASKVNKDEHVRKMSEMGFSIRAIYNIPDDVIVVTEEEFNNLM